MIKNGFLAKLGPVFRLPLFVPSRAANSEAFPVKGMSSLIIDQKNRLCPAVPQKKIEKFGQIFNFRPLFGQNWGKKSKLGKTDPANKFLVQKYPCTCKYLQLRTLYTPRK